MNSEPQHSYPVQLLEQQIELLDTISKQLIPINIVAWCTLVGIVAWVALIILMIVGTISALDIIKVF